MEHIMDKARMIDKLNEILKWEYAGLVQYTQFSFLVQDVWREVYSKFFRDNGEEALDHAHLVGDKIVALGGVPTVERGEVKQSTDLKEMLEYSLEVESLQVKLYTEALELCEDRDVAIRVLLEDICREEQEGVDHIEKLLQKRELAISPKAASTKKVG
jgi:bacterioferritin